MEDYAGIGDRVICYSMAEISIGKRAVISQGVHLCTGSHDYESTNFQLFALPIVVGSRAWVAADAFVGPGVTIGEGAVIGARAVVTDDIEPWVVVAGNPARVVKRRSRP
jgi:putative colanic acid biosynthesis acetyltransferase WcaF